MARAAASVLPVQASAALPDAAMRALPKVQSYDLPLGELAQVANASGLQWVNSNTAKIAETQAAMAAEPRAVHVPRERPPVASFDGNPLVLVETKRDLREMVLPFEQAKAATEQRAE